MFYESIVLQSHQTIVRADPGGWPSTPNLMQENWYGNNSLGSVS